MVSLRRSSSISSTSSIINSVTASQCSHRHVQALAGNNWDPQMMRSTRATWPCLQSRTPPPRPPTKHGDGSRRARWGHCSTAMSSRRRDCGKRTALLLPPPPSCGKCRADRRRRSPDITVLPPSPPTVATPASGSRRSPGPADRATASPPSHPLRIQLSQSQSAGTGQNPKLTQADRKRNDDAIAQAASFSKNLPRCRPLDELSPPIDCIPRMLTASSGTR